jgi:hypothetical protein
MKYISGLLLLITIYLNAKHGWVGLSNTMSPEETKMMADLGFNKTVVLVISVLSFVICALVLFPQTFFVGNVLNAFVILAIMAFALKGGNYKLALIEIPFLCMPLVLIYLGHPLKK